jgi:hypothetical protein
MKTKESIIIDGGYQHLSGEELKQRIVGKTIAGDYLYGYTFVGTINSNGTIEGKNNVGSYHFGEWSIDLEENTLTLKWDGGWDNWTGRSYDVEGEIKFYDITSGNWRTTFYSK